MNPEELSKAIDSLRDFINNDSFKGRMNQGSVKGFLGELLVYRKLIEEGFTPELKGNQSRYDIDLNNGNIRIDVKFSTQKKETSLKEAGKGVENFGWAIHNKTKKESVSKTAGLASHYVCVSVGRNLLVLNYYIINSKDVAKLPGSGIKQFSNIDKALMLLCDNHQFETLPNDSAFRKSIEICQNLINSGTIKKLEPSASLIEALRH